MRIEPGSQKDLEELASLRRLLWPEEESDPRADALRVLNNPAALTLVARDASGQVIGFAEAGIRRDYVNGCETSPVGFLEGIYVRDEARGGGVARALVQAVEVWTRAHGCRELASDALIDNPMSHQMHEALGFCETERVVYFRKKLD